MQIENLLRNIPRELPDELIEPLVERQGIRLERIVSRQHSTAPGEWYDQEWDEWVLLVEGEAILRFAEPDETIQMHAGDFLLIPARRRHRVERTSESCDTIWLALHLEH
ncbi:MAG: hypothetical protein C0616_08290 [Desulfuromonas sp.]|nr:MAG: hypothetical protein C0616_08290 [Desulfuromonas sp.]